MKDTHLSLKQIREKKLPNLEIGVVELPYAKLSDSLVNRIKRKLHDKHLDIVDCNEWNDSE